MKTNEQLQKDIQDAIKWEPSLHAAEIGVTVRDGIVTLSGTVDNYGKKLEAESATKRVGGVKALVENIKVEFGSNGRKDDAAVAAEVVSGLERGWAVPEKLITVEVEDGMVTLTGTVNWNFQKDAAQTAANNQQGVRWVKNNITINPHTKDEIEKEGIENALLRNGYVDDREIQVSVAGDNVSLKGVVDSWYQRDEAERTAWNTPGVRSVKNELVIDYDD